MFFRAVESDFPNEPQIFMGKILVLKSKIFRTSVFDTIFHFCRAKMEKYFLAKSHVDPSVYHIVKRKWYDRAASRGLYGLSIQTTWQFVPGFTQREQYLRDLKKNPEKSKQKWFYL
ncbi:MAG: hypothetical protein LBB40_06115 [Holophagales bacterium]|nr:hypothetical protein [Holophagales bacterium]